MKVHYLYEVSDEVTQVIPVPQLLCVATLTKVNGQSIMDTNEQPALALFNDKSIEPANGGYNILDGRTPVGFIEATTDGCDYRYYNNPDKSKATQIKCLVVADNTVDAIINPGLSIEVANGIATCTNVTLINGQDWKTFPANRTLQIKGVHYVATKVSDGNFGSVKYLLEGNGYNQLGAARKEYVKIADHPNPEADYVWTTKDQADVEEEVLAFNFIMAVKNETDYLRLTFNEIFQS
jgi:hypothetical protein